MNTCGARESFENEKKIFLNLIYFRNFCVEIAIFTPGLLLGYGFLIKKIWICAG